MSRREYAYQARPHSPTDFEPSLRTAAQWPSKWVRLNQIYYAASANDPKADLTAAKLVETEVPQPVVVAKGVDLPLSQALDAAAVDEIYPEPEPDHARFLCVPYRYTREI